MAKTLPGKILYEGKQLHAAIIKEVRQDGTYYEVNIPGFPRFYMTWSQLGRYDIVAEEGINIPYDLVLTVSDTIEKAMKRN